MASLPWPNGFRQGEDRLPGRKSMSEGIYGSGDTIAAIATALSESGISVIRISGPEAIAAADRIYRSKTGKKKLSDQESHTIHYGYIQQDGQIIDEVLVLLMRAPHTYTREDVVEIDCHGGILVTRRILEAVLAQGVRAAEPGEFTKRAFLNGRIDLSQAEAVGDIIRAKSDLALASSLSQLRGSLLTKIREVRETLLRKLAYIEAALDDPEHYELEGFDEELEETLGQETKVLRKLYESAESGRMMKEGIRTVIVGRPNVGKSSLLNALLGEERAIVTDIAGTTRDTLEETITLGGICLNIIDTAGIRESSDTVERIGVDRARDALRQSDLVIYVADGSEALDANDEEIIEMIRDRKALVILNKTDLATKLTAEELEEKTGRPVIPISAREGTNLEAIEESIRKMFFAGEISFNDEVYITNVRQRQTIGEALAALGRVEESLEAGMPEDFYSIDLMAACEALGLITGETAREDLVDTIFREFCMGK